MADTDYISVRRLRTFLAQMKQWVLGFTANRNTQAMSDVTKDTGISGTVAIGKSITIHTASGAQTANVMNADMIVDEKPTTNKDLASKAPTINLVDSMVMEAVSDAFDDITTIEYQSVNNVGKLPQVGQAGVIYLCSVWEEVENPTGNPHDLGYYVYTNGEYVLTTDTSVQSGTTYYTKAMATDEYIWLASESRYEPLGQAKVDLTGLLFAGSATSGGTAYKAAAIPFGRVDSTSTDTVFTASVEGITALEDGVCVLLQNGVVTSASGFTININNLGAHPCFNNMTAATRDTTIFAKDYTMLMIYDATRVVGGITGAWCCYRGYDANTNTIGYQVRTNSATLPVKFTTYKYRLYFTSADGTHWVGANASTSTNATSRRTPTDEKINPFGPIIYYSTNGTTNKDTVLTATTIWQQYTVTLGYSFNHTGAALVLEHPKPVYLKCTPQSDGSVKIAGSSTEASYVQALPNTEDGFVYIFLGIAYSATAIELRLEHPVYYFKDGAIRLWSNQAAAEVEIKKYNSDKTDESDEGTADYGQTDVVINGDVSTIVTTQAPPSAVRQYIAPSWRAMNQKLAEKADVDDVPHNLHVTLTSSTSGNTTTYTADHTHAEITAALASGGVVDVEYDAYLYTYDGDIDGEIYFHRVSSKSISNPNSSDNVYDHMFYVEVVNDADVWTFEEPTKLIANASTSRTGVVQLNDAVNSTSTTQAATANAVKKVNDAIPTKTSDLTNDSGYVKHSNESYEGHSGSWSGTATVENVGMHPSSITFTIPNGQGIKATGTNTYPLYIINSSKTKILATSTTNGTVSWANLTGESVTVYVAIDDDDRSSTFDFELFNVGFDSAIEGLQEQIGDKQDIISDLETIRSGASKGATAIQPTDIKDELDPGGNGEIPDSAAIAAYIEEKTPTKPTTSTDNAVARYDGTTGNLQNSGVTIDDSNNVTTAGNVQGKNLIVQGSNTTNVTRYISSDAANNMFVSVGGVTPFVINNTEVRRGSSASTINLGSSTYPWNNVYGKKFITYGGTSSQFVKGDGSLDSNPSVKMDKVGWVGAGHENLASIENLYYNVGLNVLAFLNPEYVTAEYTTDGGTTWLDYEASNDAKIALFTTSGSLAVGKKTGSVTRTNNDAVRVTISVGCGTYCHSEFIIIRYYGAGGVSIKVEYTTYADTTTFVEHTTLTNLSTNPGNIIIPFDKYLFGNNGVHDLRLTMTYTGSTYPTLLKSFYMIRVYSNNVYSTPSNLAASGHLYSFDVSQNATFPAKITSTGFVKSGGTSSQFLKADGSVDSNTYLTSHQDISGKVDYADGTKTTTTKQMGTTAVTIDGISMYTSESTTYTIQSGYTISIDAQGTSMGYIYQNSNSTILAQDPSGDVEWTNTTGESVVVKIGSATSGENYAVTIFKKGYYSTIEELTEKIEEAAASGVQADWNEDDSDDPAYIKNKPTVYTKPSSGIPKSDLANAVQTSLGKADTALQSHQDISGKVDKVDGKGLSTNDYTTAEKTKLGGISEGAEVNVQSNWNETNSSSDAYIQNKPTIPTALADLTEDSSHKVVSQTSITTWNDKAEKVTQVNHGTSDTTYTITPNVLHVWGEVTSLNITLGTGENGVVNEYMFQFYSGNTPTTLTLPNSVIWVQPLTTQAGKTYQVSIVNNLACYITDGMAAAESSGGTPTYATQAWVTSLIDSVPTANSSNVPSSGGTYDMIEGGYYYS